MPLTRRIPKRGFTNPFREEAQVVRLDSLAGVAGDEVTTETLVAAGLIRSGHGPAKLLSTGDVPRAQAFALATLLFLLTAMVIVAADRPEVTDARRA
jgi:large subunit ribosomal protein L15